MLRKIISSKIAWLAVFFSACLGTQAMASPTAVEDNYTALADQTFIEEAPGVLDNDMGSDGEDLPAGATAELIQDVSNGTLTFNPDGSFTYEPAPGFTGSVFFIYRAFNDGLFSNDTIATIVISGCSGGPELYSCWIESSYLSKLEEIGSGLFYEGFEQAAAWGDARTPNTKAQVASNGITWASNNDAPGSAVTTSSGPARTGNWAMYSSPHGDPRKICTNPDIPEFCPPMYDGFIGRSRTGTGIIHGVGAWFTGSHGSRVEMIIDGDATNPVALGPYATGHRFYGVIRTTGFSAFEFRETEGRSEDMKLLFADDFAIGVAKQTVEINLSVGLNLVGYPVHPQIDYSSYDLLNDLGSAAEVDFLLNYDSSGNIMTTTAYSGTTPTGAFFPVNSSAGYLVYMKQAKQVSFTGPLVPPILILHQGFNIISIQTVPPLFTSFELLRLLGTQDEVTSIQRFNTTTGAFETAAYQDGMVIGSKFPITQGEAYFVQMKTDKLVEQPVLP